MGRHKIIKSHKEHQLLRYRSIHHSFCVGMSDGNVYKMFSYMYNNSNSLGNTLENYSMDLVNGFQTINTPKSQTPKTDPNVFSLTDKGYQDFFSVSASLPLRWMAV